MKNQLQALDLFVCLKILALRPNRLTFQELGDSLAISASQAYTATHRCVAAKLLNRDLEVRKHALLEVIGCCRSLFPGKFNDYSIGMPTAYGVSPLLDFLIPNDDPVPIWAFKDGKSKGLTIDPLYKTAPIACVTDTKLYEYLSLIDAIRIGRAREQSFADDYFRRLLEPN